MLDKTRIFIEQLSIPLEIQAKKDWELSHFWARHHFPSEKYNYQSRELFFHQSRNYDSKMFENYHNPKFKIEKWVSSFWLANLCHNTFEHTLSYVKNQKKTWLLEAKRWAYSLFRTGRCQSKFSDHSRCLLGNI